MTPESYIGTAEAINFVVLKVSTHTWHLRKVVDTDGLRYLEFVSRRGPLHQGSMSSVETKFKKAAYLIKHGPPDGKTTNEKKLLFYSYFKQATDGDVKGSRVIDLVIYHVLIYMCINIVGGSEQLSSKSGPI